MKKCLFREEQKEVSLMDLQKRTQYNQGKGGIQNEQKNKALDTAYCWNPDIGSNILDSGNCRNLSCDIGDHLHFQEIVECADRKNQEISERLEKASAVKAGVFFYA